MKHSRLTRLAAILLAAVLLFSFAAVAADMPDDMPPDDIGGGGGGNVPAPPPGGGSHSFYTGDAVTELESGDYSGETFADSTGESEVAVRVGPGVVASISDSTITKTAGELSGDDSSFYGVNSGILAYSEDENTPAELTLDGVTVETSTQGANGVFAYGDATISIKNSTVTTGEGGSGGIMVAGGGTLYAENCTVTTEGGSSAAIRSDRGSGVMVIDGGTYISNGSKGTGSPAIYCVADITASNCTLQANNAQAICFEGRNPFHMYNCYLEGNYTASDDDENSNVMIYQSMSGDSTEGTTFCTMVGGVLKANNTSENGNAKMFYTTNTYCYISLCDVKMVYSDTMETFLLCACNTNQRGWGTAGANGSECVLYTVDQDMDGNIIYDTWSYLGVYMTEGSILNGAILCREDNGDRGCDLYMDDSCVWTVTGDSVVRDFYNPGSQLVDADGNTVAVVAGDGTVYVEGSSQYTITVTGTYGTEDLSAQENVPGIGTVEDGGYTFDTDMTEYFNEEYIPTAPDGTMYADTLGHVSEDEPMLIADNPEASVEEEALPEEETAVPAEPEQAEAEDAPEETAEAEPEEASETDATLIAENPENDATAEAQSSKAPVVIVVIVLIVIVLAAAVVVVKKKKK